MSVYATIKRVIFNDEDYYVLKTDVGVVVIEYDKPIKKGDSFVFEGEYVDHPIYGEQFKAAFGERYEKVRKLRPSESAARSAFNKYI